MQGAWGNIFWYKSFAREAQCERNSEWRVWEGSIKTSFREMQCTYDYWIE
jgi:hypothetical protein